MLTRQASADSAISPAHLWRCQSASKPSSLLRGNAQAPHDATTHLFGWQRDSGPPHRPITASPDGLHRSHPVSWTSSFPRFRGCPLACQLHNGTAGHCRLVWRVKRVVFGLGDDGEHAALQLRRCRWGATSRFSTCSFGFTAWGVTSTAAARPRGVGCPTSRGRLCAS